MPMNSVSLHCMSSDWKSRLSLTRACVFFSFFSRVELLCAHLHPFWTRARPVWTSGQFVPVLDPCLNGFGQWLICGFLWTIGELLVGSLLDRIGFLGHFVIGLSIGIVCVIAVL